MSELTPEIYTGFVSSDGEQIYYESAGNGEVLLFCHGLGGNHANWFQQVPFFVGSYRCVTWDQRGFGCSTNHGEEVSPALAVRDMKRLVDELGLAPFHLVGQSMGGWAAVGFALAYPEMVRSLVLTDTLGGIYTEESRSALATFVEQAATIPSALPRLGYHPALGRGFSQRASAQAYLYQQLGSFSKPPSTLAMFRTLRDTAYEHEDLRRLTMPILCIVGSEDRLILPQWVRQIATVLPHAQFVEIPGAGHSPYFEDADAWNKIVLEFMMQQASA